MRKTILLFAAMVVLLASYAGVALATLVEEAEPNDTRTAAQNIDDKFSLDNDPNIDNSTTVPHASVHGTGNNTYDYYSFTVPQAGRGTLGVMDIDGGMPEFDSYLRLYDASGNLLAQNDDSFTDPGTVHPWDSYLRYNFPYAGTYYLKVSRFVDIPIPSGADYLLHVSVPNHDTNTAPTDTTPPELILPANITEEATSPSGSVVTFTVAATDQNPSTPQVSCSPASGSTFPIGTTRVNCEATDAAGNRATGSFDVTVQDTTAPEISGVPSSITEEATGASGAKVTYTAPTATDLVDGDLSVTCDPASGSTFPIGTTQVNCSAEDAAGNEATDSFNVTVQDTTAPTISGMPSDVTKTATSKNGATVTYNPPAASDIVDGSVTVNCSPGSGSTFALGETTVTCTASDSRNNTANETFKVNVTYSWSGVLQPINGGSTSNTSDDDSVFKLGRTVPVKFKLTGDSAGITDATAKLYMSKISDGVAGDEDEAESTAASTSGNLFRYDATGDQYIFNWGTKGLETGAGTYRLRIDLADGTTNTVLISLR